jgi:hypothetical protein
VRRKGLEPPRLAALEPKSSASTNSATLATLKAVSASPATVDILPERPHIASQIASMCLNYRVFLPV